MNLILRQVIGYQQGKKSAPVSIDPKLKTELDQTKKDLHQILTKWKFGEETLTSADQFLAKFEPWINTQLNQQKNLKLFLTKKGVNNLTEAETKLTNRDLPESAELEQVRQELNTKEQELAQAQETWNNTEADYLNQIQELKDLEISQNQEVSPEVADLQAEISQLKEQLETYARGEDWESKTGEIIKDLEQEVKDLTTDNDQLTRDKTTLEQETLALNNQLRNKSEEVTKKEQTIQQLKKEKSASEIALNQKLTEKNTILSQKKTEYEELEKKYKKKAKFFDEEQLENNRLHEKVEQLEAEIKQLKGAK